MSLGTNLEQLRKRAGLTQGELARKIFSSQKTISSWETGRTYPRMKDIQAICDALGCTIEALTGSKTRSLGDVSYDDILVKLQTLDIFQLKKLREVCTELIKNKEELQAMEEMRNEYMKQIEEYEKQIKELKRRTGEDDD